MAVAVDAVSATNGDLGFAGATTVSGTPITATAAATCVVASVVFGDNIGISTPTSVVVQWAAQTLSIVTGTDTGFVNGSVNTNRAFLATIGSPTTGLQTAKMTWTNTYAGYFNMMSWKGSDTTTPCKNGTSTTNTSTAPSINVTSPTNDFAVGCMFDDSQAISGTNQTEWWVDTGRVNNGAANYTAGAGTTTLSTAAITSDFWGYAACDVQVPAGAAAQTPYQPYFQQMLAS